MIKQYFYMIMKNETYLIETPIPTCIKFCTIGKPKLFTNEKKAKKQSETIGGTVVKVKIEKNK